MAPLAGGQQSARHTLDTWAKFEVLCAIYAKLKSVLTKTTFPEALAQTCWMLKEEKDGRPWV